MLMKEKLGRAVKNSCFDVMFLNFILILKPQEAAEGQASCVAPWDVLQLFIDLDSNHKQLFETRAYAFPGSLESPAAQNRPTSKPVCYVPECVHIEYDSITLWYPCGFFFSSDVLFEWAFALPHFLSAFGVVSGLIFLPLLWGSKSCIRLGCLLLLLLLQHLQLLKAWQSTGTLGSGPRQTLCLPNHGGQNLTPGSHRLWLPLTTWAHHDLHYSFSILSS